MNPAQQTDGDVHSSRDQAGPASEYAWIPRIEFKTDQLVVEALSGDATKDQYASISKSKHNSAHNEPILNNDENDVNDDMIAAVRRPTRTGLPVIKQLVSLANAANLEAFTKGKRFIGTPTHVIGIEINGIIPKKVITSGIYAGLQHRCLRLMGKIELIGLRNKRLPRAEFQREGHGPLYAGQLSTDSVSLQRERTGNQPYNGRVRITTLHGNKLPTQLSGGLTLFLVTTVDAAQHKGTISGW
jgi:hypothetical protein